MARLGAVNTPNISVCLFCMCRYVMYTFGIHYCSVRWLRYFVNYLARGYAFNKSYVLCRIHEVIEKNNQRCWVFQMSVFEMHG